MLQTSLTDRHVIRIVIDENFEAAGSVSWDDPEAEAEYVAKFETGELTAYGVMLLLLDEDGEDEEELLGSLWGCDVENGAADGTYSRLEDVPDDYLREVAADLVSEAPEPATCGTCGWVWHHGTPADRCPRELYHPDVEEDDEPIGVTITRDQLEAWAGRTLTDDEVLTLDINISNSSIPEAIGVMADNL